MKTLPSLHLGAVPAAAAAWLGATLLLGLWTSCLPTTALLAGLLLTWGLCSSRRTCLTAPLLPAQGKAVLITGKKKPRPRPQQPDGWLCVTVRVCACACVCVLSC